MNQRVTMPNLSELHHIHTEDATGFDVYLHHQAVADFIATRIVDALLNGRDPNPFDLEGYRSASKQAAEAKTQCEPFWVPEQEWEGADGTVA